MPEALNRVYPRILDDTRRADWMAGGLVLAASRPTTLLLNNDGNVTFGSEHTLFAWPRSRG